MNPRDIPVHYTSPSSLNNRGRERVDFWRGERDDDWRWKPPIYYDASNNWTLASRQSPYNYDVNRTLYRPLNGKTAMVGPANLWRYHAEPEPKDFAEYFTYEKKTFLKDIDENWEKKMEANPGATNGGQYMFPREIETWDWIFSTDSWGVPGSQWYVQSGWGETNPTGRWKFEWNPFPRK